MIKNDNLIAEHKLNILHIHVVNLMSRKLLVVLKQIVTEETYCPSSERRHFRQFRAAILPQNCFKLLYGLRGYACLLITFLLNDDLAFFHRKHQERVCTDKRIPCPLNSTFYTFQ
ncbi:hypothetical protein D1872_233280 [compost metagenome]